MYCLKCGNKIEITSSNYISCNNCGLPYYIKDNYIKILNYDNFLKINKK